MTCADGMYKIAAIGIAAMAAKDTDTNVVQSPANSAERNCANVMPENRVPIKVPMIKKQGKTILGVNTPGVVSVK